MLQAMEGIRSGGLIMKHEYSVSADMNAYEIAGVIAVYLLDN